MPKTHATEGGPFLGGANNANDNAVRGIRHRMRPHPSNEADSIKSNMPDLAQNQASAGYEVGYRKPPKHSQFRKGKSGNPRGRPRSTVSTTAMVEEALNKRMSVKIDGKQQSLTARQIAISQQVKKAVSGDQKALQFLLSYLPTEAMQGQARTDVETLAENEDSIGPLERAMLAHHQRDLMQTAGLSDDQIGLVLAGLGLEDSAYPERASS